MHICCVCVGIAHVRTWGLLLGCHRLWDVQSIIGPPGRWLQTRVRGNALRFCPQCIWHVFVISHAATLTIGHTDGAGCERLRHVFFPRFFPHNLPVCHATTG